MKLNASLYRGLDAKQAFGVMTAATARGDSQELDRIVAHLPKFKLSGVDPKITELAQHAAGITNMAVFDLQRGLGAHQVAWALTSGLELGTAFGQSEQGGSKGLPREIEQKFEVLKDDQRRMLVMLEQILQDFESLCEQEFGLSAEQMISVFAPYALDTYRSVGLVVAQEGSRTGSLVR